MENELPVLWLFQHTLKIPKGAPNQALLLALVFRHDCFVEILDLIQFGGDNRSNMPSSQRLIICVGERDGSPKNVLDSSPL